MSNVKFKFAGLHFDPEANYGQGEQKARFVRFDENHPDAEAKLKALTSKNAAAFIKARDGIVDWSLKQVQENIAKIEKDPKHAETLSELIRAKATLVAETKVKPKAAFGNKSKPEITAPRRQHTAALGASA
jgi:hypothetical protein